jgi:putative MATE family efflux protein
MLVINVINIVVAYTLANGTGPLPALGVLGSGIGAAAGRGLGGVLIVALLVRGSGRSPVKIEAKVPRPDFHIIAQILRIGLPTAGEQLLMHLGQILLATFITGLGTVAYAAHQVTIQALSVAYMPGFGFALAATTLVGQELGAQRPQRAVQSTYETLRLTLLIMTTMGLLVALFPAPVLRVFTDDPGVIADGLLILRIAGLIMPMLGVSFTVSGALRGAGDTTSVLVILGACIWGLRITNAFWLGPLLGLTGIWLAIGIDFVGRAVILARRFRSGKWQFVRV